MPHRHVLVAALVAWALFRVPHNLLSTGRRVRSITRCGRLCAEKAHRAKPTRILLVDQVTCSQSGFRREKFESLSRICKSMAGDIAVEKPTITLFLLSSAVLDLKG
jgi:hypothetical protein